ncbi:MAG: MATE family efflux transporter [Faecalibacterium sp.]
MAQTKQDMGTGNIKKLMLQLMIPTVVAQIVNLLYNIVDRIYIGHIEGIGAAALTGVGLFAPILMLLNAFAMLIGAGGAPRTAIALGQGHKEEAERILSSSFTMLMIFSAVLTVLFYALAPALLRLFGASDITLPYALAYSRIYILGSVFVLLVLGMNPFITAQGFTRISMLTTVIGAVINIILDPILIFGFGLGVRGAAIATVLSQAVGAVWILLFLTGKKTGLRLRPALMRPQAKTILPVMALGVSSFVMISTESLLSISFTSSLARYGGDLAVGAMTIITSVAQLCSLPVQGLCQGAQPVISFNFGAAKKDRVKQAFRFLLILCAGYTVLFWALMMLAPGAAAGIFTSDAGLISYSTWAIRIYMAGIFSLGFQIACQQTFMALGQAKVSLLLACLRKIILLIPLIFILPHLLPDPVFAVFLAEPVSDIIAAVVTTTTFLRRFDHILDKGAGVV